ncbi:MAG: hypothetical protein H6845_00075 [Alphaproteobacteria bacterium]|nr:MAG: hypothetical protein H6845_00075 [Alphaproteobacteria bacterium]
MIISDVGMALPKFELHNNDLPTDLDTSHEWIHTRTGIETRYIAKDETTYSLALASVKNMQFKNLKMIIVATSTPDYAFPSCASYLFQNLHLTDNNVTCFDIHDACNGFVQALDLALLYISQYSEYAEALVVGAETMSKLLNWQDRSTAVLFGGWSRSCFD